MRLCCVALALVLGFCAACAREETVPSAPEAPIVLENGSFTLEADGRTIHYEVHGSGPVVMALTNSWGLSLEGLRNLFASLEERLTMVYFDPRGMGESSPVVDDTDMSLAAVREDFDAVRQHLGLDAVNAIGWSNGATNLILLAAERPGTISTAIFVHGAASFGPEDFAAFAQNYPELTQLYVAFQQEMADESLTDAERTERMREMWLGRYFPTITGDPETAGPAIQAVFDDAEFSWPHGQYAQQENPGFDFRDKLALITAPSLVIAGAHDSLPPDRVRELSDGIADARFVVFESSGHFAPIEEPEAFAAMIFDFLGLDGQGALEESR
jgi:proline iminopeptidase